MKTLENAQERASADRNIKNPIRLSRFRHVARYCERLWRGAAAWQQALAIAVATVLGLQLFMRLMTFITFGDRGWFVCWRLAGVTAACMLRTQRRRWPWILCGLVLSLLWTGVEIHAPAGDMALSVAANVLEVCIAAFFLPPFTTTPDWIRTPHLTFRFTVFALVLAPISGAIVAAGYFAHLNQTSYMQSALFWWLGDSLGMVLWLPMILVATTPELYALFHWNNLPKTAGLLTLMVGVSLLAFVDKSAPLVFVILPVLLWIGLRLGFAGSVLATNLLALLFTAGSLTGHTPFILLESEPDLQVRALQIFLLAAMLMALPISVVLFERDAFAIQLQDAYIRMEVQANLDPLTGVANRRRFDEALHLEWQRALRDKNHIALLMVDSDEFKAYNDFYGHQAGDEILRRIAHAMRSVLRRPTDLLARYGGEEFSILLPGTDEEGTRRLAENVRRVVLDEHIVHPDSASGFVTVSIGCWSVVPTAGNSPSTLIMEADAALYAAKRKGRNRVEYGRITATADL
jgi:diguanylate cyclase (GGDEF)-like protein